MFIIYSLMLLVFLIVTIALEMFNETIEHDVKETFNELHYNAVENMYLKDTLDKKRAVIMRGMFNKHSNKDFN
jgi:hypothetical protein